LQFAGIARWLTFVPDFMQLSENPGIFSGLSVIQDHQGRVSVFTSASPRCLDGGDVDVLHRHHRLEGTLGLTATSRKRIG
jgi:hypothetical protein